MVHEVKGVEFEGLRGGKGKGIRYEIIPKEELYGHGRLYARNVLFAGSSVGWHQHVNDTEPYYILRGEGDFIEGDSENGERKVTHVRAGDVCTIQIGQWHSLENNSDGELEFMALIYNKAGYLS
ncbi:MAG: cupin domain-containing protein [Synergistaceae bacterium]|nr:cupin domain-containing protein [Synergistaceae bacterium]MBR1657327.1 cupin domain-containing protein [Synergistaceae bacterium]